MIRQEYTFSSNEVNLMNQLRKLWIDHVLWTRSFIISRVEGLSDLEKVTNRLLRNPQDFADLFGVFYGVEIGNELKDLLTEHLLIAADLVNAAIQGNTEKVNNERALWYNNADEIANFLSTINPYWNISIWQQHLYDHLSLTENEAVQRISGNYEEDIMLYDRIEDQALSMADYMFEGLLKQMDLY